MRSTVLGCVLLLSCEQFVSAMDLITHINESTISTSTPDYGNTLLLELDFVAKKYYDELSRIGQEELLELLNGDAVNRDATFILLCSWIRVRANVDKNLVEALEAAGYLVRPMSPYVAYITEDDYLSIDSIGAPATELIGRRGWMITIDGSLEVPHVLALTSRKTGSDVKDTTLTDTRITNAWWIVDSARSGKHLVLRRIERGWH